MRIINITPLLLDVKDEIVKDLIALKNECGVTDVAFIMSLHPQVTPLLDKPQRLCREFMAMQEALRDSGLRIGILIQSLIGHGERGDAGVHADFQRVISFDKTSNEQICPLDKGFQQYVKDTFELLSKAKPDFFLMDDDFAIFGGGLPGCFCKAHLASFNKLMDRQCEFNELIEILGKKDEESCRIGNLWSQSLTASMVDLAKLIRNRINSVDDTIPCGYAVSMLDISVLNPVIHALAGNTEPFIRANGACYMLERQSTRFFAKRMCHIATQTAYLKDIPEILVEADTFPQNRYSCSAKYLHAHITGSLLNGVNGIMQWITRTGWWEPEAGVEYRKILRQNQGFYNELHKLEIDWSGPGVPLPETPVSSWNPMGGYKQTDVDSWYDIFYRLGIPFKIGASAKINMISGDEVDFFTDNELFDFCSKGLLLDGLAAQKMCERGLGKYMGIKAESTRLRVSHEQMKNYTDSGSKSRLSLLNGAFSTCKITIMDKAVKVFSDLMLSPWFHSPNSEYQCPGLTLFKNSLGGRVAVFATSVTNSGFGVRQSNFLNSFRKKQLMCLLEQMDEQSLLPVALDDIDLYVKYGNIKSLGKLLCVFNLNLDTLPRLRMRMSKKEDILEMHFLTASGKWEKLDWEVEDNQIVLETPVKTMEPLIIKYRTH